MGSFQIYDVVGLGTAYNILSSGDEHSQRLAAWLKEHYIDRGRIGAGAGGGFYDDPQG